MADEHQVGLTASSLQRHVPGAARIHKRLHGGCWDWQGPGALQPTQEGFRAGSASQGWRLPPAATGVCQGQAALPQHQPWGRPPLLYSPGLSHPSGAGALGHAPASPTPPAASVVARGADSAPGPERVVGLGWGAARGPWLCWERTRGLLGQRQLSRCSSVMGTETPSRLSPAGVWGCECCRPPHNPSVPWGRGHAPGFWAAGAWTPRGQ